MTVDQMENIDIASLQMDIKWGSVEENLASIDSYFIESPQADIYLLPETFATGFVTNKARLTEVVTQNNLDKILDSMKRWSANKKAWVGGTAFVLNGDRYRNRFFMIGPSGEIISYDKRHLFGIAGEADYFKGGGSRVVLNIKGWRLMLTVCYDIRFPVWLRQQSVNGEYEYDGILVPANWPESRQDAWVTLLKARAMENQCYVVGVNRIGVDGFGSNHIGGSSTIGPKGDVLAEFKHPKRGWISTTLDAIHLSAVRKRYPFIGDADSFTLQ
jgi:predicted amidohydrolase